MILLIVLGMQHLGVDMNSCKALLGAIVGQKDHPWVHQLQGGSEPAYGWENAKQGHIKRGIFHGGTGMLLALHMALGTPGISSAACSWQVSREGQPGHLGSCEIHLLRGSLFCLTQNGEERGWKDVLCGSGRRQGATDVSASPPAPWCYRELWNHRMV